jgi:hypothetical protein
MGFALHEDLLTALNTLLTLLALWVTAVDALGPFIPETANLQGQITAVMNGIVAGDYQSPSVKVEKL